MLKASGTKRLKLNYDRLLSILLQFCFNFAFKFNLRRYIMARAYPAAALGCVDAGSVGQGMGVSH
jgi:hypothetical protein